MSLPRLTEYLASVPLDAVPADVAARTSRVLADTAAAITAGMAEPEMQGLLETAPSGGPSSVLGAAKATHPGEAAFLNGAAGVFLELDEGSSTSKGHPAIHVVPALLAWSEAHPGDDGRDGARFIRALALGYEVAVRMGAAANLRPSMHPHGTWGLLGGAAALAIWDGADAADIDNTLRIAASLALATSRPTMTEGATVRNAYSGIAGQNAVQARRMARAGFKGDRDALGVVFGQVIGQNWDPSPLSEDLGEDWAIRHGYFKRHACCRYNHAALDALADLRAANPGDITPETVEAVDISTYALAAALDDPTPQTMLAAKFSLPFALATSIRRDGDTWLDAFRPDAMNDPVTLALARRVRLTVDPEIDRAVPEKRMARVAIRLADGKQLEAFREFADGDPEIPFSDANLDAKFMALTQPTLGAEGAAAAHRTAFAIARAQTTSEVTAAFQPSVAVARTAP